MKISEKKIMKYLAKAYLEALEEWKDAKYGAEKQMWDEIAETIANIQTRIMEEEEQ